MYFTRRELFVGFGGLCSSFFLPPVRSEAAMIEPSSVPENIMYSTTRIIGIDAGGREVSAGTGFFYNFPLEANKIVPVLITNKHVVDKTEGIRFVVHTKTAGSNKPDGKHSIQVAASLGKGWIAHPNDKIDLCALPVGGVFSTMNPPPFFRALDPSIVPSQQNLEALDAVEDILMAGYPNGLWDEVNNYPLMRRGITASHPAIDFFVREHPSTPTTVVDIAAFHGSSGSPVFIFNKSGYADKMGNVTIGPPRIYFLGVLFSGPIAKANGEVTIGNIPTNPVAVANVNVTINLGYIIKAKEVEPIGQAVFAGLGIALPQKAP